MKNKPNKFPLIVSLFLVITIDTMGIGFVWPLFGPLFTGKETVLFTSATPMEWRNILYGITIGVANFATFLCAPIIGAISDKIGRRKIFIFCLFGNSMGLSISVIGIIFNNLILIILSRICLGIFAASQVLAQATVIDISDKYNKFSRLGVISAANNIGFIFGPVISSMLVDNTLVYWFDITTPFYFASIIALFSAIFVFKYFEEPYEKKIFSDGIKEKLNFSKMVFSFSRVFASKNIKILAIIYFCIQVGWAIYLQTSCLLLIQKYLYITGMLGYFMAWIGIIFCFGLLVIVNFIANSVYQNKFVFSILFVAVLTCCITVFNRNATEIWIYSFPIAIAISVCANFFLGLLSNFAKKHDQGWIMGVGSSLAALAWAITPPITGMLMMFGFGVPLFIAALFLFVGLILFFVFIWQR